MNKSSQIFLLIVVFAACVAGGYFIGEAVLDDSLSKDRERDVETQRPVLSSIPVISDISSVSGNGEKYSFSVFAYVDSEDPMIYSLFSDEDCLKKVVENYDGEFKDVPGTASQTYYLQVKNFKTDEVSETVPVKGFAKSVPKKVKKITVTELEHIINTKKNWNAAPEDYKYRLATGFRPNILGTDPAREARQAKSLGDVCVKIANENWSYVRISNPRYNAQDQLTSVDIYVNYPD